MDLHLIVEKANGDWKGEVGLITKLLPKLDVPMNESFAIVCGPPVMFKFVCGDLSKRGMAMERMFVSSRDECTAGMGKCRRCKHRLDVHVHRGPGLRLLVGDEPQGSDSGEENMRYLGIEAKKPRIAVFDFTCARDASCSSRTRKRRSPLPPCDRGRQLPRGVVVRGETTTSR